MKTLNLDKIRKGMEKFDKVREEIIRDSRKIIRDSKTAIYAIHRDEKNNASKTLVLMKEELGKLRIKVKKVPRLQFEGIFRVAVQEYVEALALFEFVYRGKVVDYNEEFVDIENYLMGLCDLSGELVRKAINSSIKEDYDMVLKIRGFLEHLYTELSNFDFRNGELRRKYDGIKYDVKKLDDVVFQLKMKDKI